MRNRKGYSLVMWTVILAIGLGAVTIYQVSAKRALQAKVMRSADHLFWGMWQADPQQYMDVDRSLTNTLSAQHVVTVNRENNGNVGLDFNVHNSESRHYQSRD